MLTSQAMQQDQTGTPGGLHAVSRHRHEIRRRTLVVEGVQQLTPRMLRVRFTAADLADFRSLGFDDHVKLFFPVDNAEPVKRDYTPRMFDAARGTIVLDFALHENGPATDWARRARAGDSLEIGGPRGSMVVRDDFDWYWLIGDETALPAIGRRLEELRPGVPVTSVVVTDNPTDRQTFVTAADWQPYWVERHPGGGTETTALRRVLEGLPTPPGDGFVWIAAEADVAHGLRDYMLEVRGHAPAWLKASGYWVR